MLVTCAVCLILFLFALLTLIFIIQGAFLIWTIAKQESFVRISEYFPAFSFLVTSNTLIFRIIQFLDSFKVLFIYTMLAMRKEKRLRLGYQDEMGRGRGGGDAVGSQYVDTKYVQGLLNAEGMITERSTYKISRNTE